jgi:hypothetical protein
MQKSPVDHYSTYSNAMQFANTPSGLGQKPGHMMPRQVYAIRREYANDSDTHVPPGISATTLDQETNL